MARAVPRPGGVGLLSGAAFRRPLPGLALPAVYGITDLQGGRYATHAEAAALLASAGVRLVQVRDKGDDRSRLASARAASALRAGSTGLLVLVNDRPDVALLSGADGVHLGGDDLPASAARRLLGDGAVIGVSTHDVEACLRAADDPVVSYVALGPVFPTTTKESGRVPLGLEAIRAVVTRGLPVPLVVIGGITPERAGDCVAAGADSVAMIAGLLDGDVHANVARATAAIGRGRAARAPGGP